MSSSCPLQFLLAPLSFSVLDPRCWMIPFFVTLFSSSFTLPILSPPVSSPQTLSSLFVLWPCCRWRHDCSVGAYKGRLGHNGCCRATALSTYTPLQRQQHHHYHEVSSNPLIAHALCLNLHLFHHLSFHTCSRFHVNRLHSVILASCVDTT